MSTKHLRKIRTRQSRTDPARAARVRKATWMILGAFLLATSIAFGFMVAGINVPAWAWYRP